MIRRAFSNVRIARVGKGFAVLRGPLLVGIRATFNEAYFLARGAS